MIDRIKMFFIITFMFMFVGIGVFFIDCAYLLFKDYDNFDIVICDGELNA